MNYKLRMNWLLVSLVVMCASSAIATPVAVQNPGFEEPQTGGWVSMSTLPGWNIEYGTFFSNPWDKSQGNQGLYGAGESGFRVTQVLVGAALPNTSYTVSVDVCDNNSNGNSTAVGLIYLPDSTSFFQDRLTTMSWETNSKTFVSPSTWVAGSDLVLFVQVGPDDLTIDNVRVETTSAPSVSGTVVLTDYTAGLSNIAVRVDLLQNDLVVRSEVVVLDSTGGFTIPGVGVGVYDVRVKSGASLSTTIAGVDVTGVTNIGTVTLINGDLDGDNEVTSTDLSILGLNLGMIGS